MQSLAAVHDRHTSLFGHAANQCFDCFCPLFKEPAVTHSLCLIKSTACFALAFSILLNSQRFHESKHNDIDPSSHFTNHKKRDSQC